MIYIIRFVLNDGQVCFPVKHTAREMVCPREGLEWLTVSVRDAKGFDSFDAAHVFLELKGFGFNNEMGFTATTLSGSPFKSWEIIPVDYSQKVK